MPFRAIAPVRRGKRMRLYYVWWKVARVMMCSDYYYCILHSASSQSIMSVGHSQAELSLFKYVSLFCTSRMRLSTIIVIIGLYCGTWLWVNGSDCVSLTLFKISSQCIVSALSTCTWNEHAESTHNQTNTHTQPTRAPIELNKKKKFVCGFQTKAISICYTQIAVTTPPRANAFYVLPLRRW